MWTSIKAARAILAAATVLLAGLAASPSQAQGPVEYVRVCTLYGAGFFYIPGTDTCVQARQIVDNQFAIARLNTRAATGTAMAASLVAPWLPSGTNYAVSNHWAGFDGQHALGFSGLMRISGNFVFSGGFAAGLDRGKLNTFSERTQTAQGTSTPAESWSEIRMLSRAGFMYAW
jgi:hypothetical protein